MLFDAPGPGTWVNDRSHLAYPATSLIQSLFIDSFENAYRTAFAEVGVPADTFSIRFVHGYMYTRLRPLFGANAEPKKAPPAPIIKAVFRLHPELRRRSKLAERFLEDRPWRQVCADWPQRSAEIQAANEALQQVDLSALDAEGLAAHVTQVYLWCAEMFELHQRLHIFDLGPIGMLLDTCLGWDIVPGDVVPALAGASPATTEPLHRLAEIRSAVEASGTSPESLAELRAISPAIDGLVTAYLDRRGWVVYSGYDLDSHALIEDPAVMFQSIVSAQIPAEADHEAIIAALRERVPAADRSTFDDHMAEARAAMGMRDAQGPLTIEWPMGLLRRALLEVGARAASDGRLADSAHAIELSVDELGPFASGAAAPSASVLAARADQRRTNRDLDPPYELGPPAIDPPLDAMPPAMAKMIRITELSVLELFGVETPADADGTLNGIGIGTRTFEGIAIVAETSEEALDRLEPDMVLITRATSPAYNMVLGIAGGLVTASGGPMAHAAVLARELDLPAVIGATGAMEAIPDGATVRVDPVNGTVRVLSTP